MKTKAKKILFLVTKTVLVLAFWLIVWALLAKKVGLELLLPSPKTTAITLFELAKTFSFWKITFNSLMNVLIGILVSLVIGSVLAVMTEKSKVLDALFSPVLTVIKSTPIASFIILTLLWIKKDSIPVFIISLIVIPIVWSNISAGIRSVDKNLHEVSRIYSFSIVKKILRLYIPSIFPFFLAACKASLGMAWKAGISAEILSTPKNTIGTELYFSKTYFSTEQLFAWTLTVIILSFIIEKILIYLIEKIADHSKFTVKDSKKDVMP